MAEGEDSLDAPDETAKSSALAKAYERQLTQRAFLTGGEKIVDQLKTYFLTKDFDMTHSKRWTPGLLKLFK